MKAITTIFLVWCCTLVQAQEFVDLGGFTIGYNVGMLPRNVYDHWTQQHNQENDFSPPLEAPSVLSGLHLGLYYHGDFMDVGFGYSWRSNAQQVEKKDVFGEVSTFKYKYKYGVLHFPELVLYPGQPYVGIGATCDAGQFKVTRRDMSRRFGGGGVASTWNLGHQYMIRFRIPGDGAVGSLSVYYQHTYLRANWTASPSEELGYRPNLIGAKFHITFPVFD